jgi:F0F1-type ATP synthase assembly protein I
MSKSSNLLAKQRQRWQSQESDDALARRAQRIYLRLSLIYLLCAVAFFTLLSSAATALRVLGATGCFIGAFIFYWQSRRFAKIRSGLKK